MVATVVEPVQTTNAPDKASDVLRASRHPLDALFQPRSVAVIGATEKQGSVGRTVLWNLISSPFGGTVLPVNPKRDNVLGVRAYPSLAAIDQPVDLAVVVTPAPSVPGVMAECAAKGVKGVDRHLGRLPRDRPGRGGAGAAHPRPGARGAHPGHRAQLPGRHEPHRRHERHLRRRHGQPPGRSASSRQSGALLTAVLDWSAREGVGFSSVVSLGSMLDVGWGDVIYYLGDDPAHQVDPDLHGDDRRRARLPVAPRVRSR